MTIDNLTAAYGFTKMPFGRDIAPQALNQHRAHQEAVARIAWCVAESSIGVVTGECGSGKTVAARAALSALDASRHTVIYLGTPGVGLRGTYAAIVAALGGVPRFHCGSLIPQAADLLAQEAEERGKKVTLCLDEVQLSYGTACQAPRIACATADSGRGGPKARRTNRTEQSAGSPPG